MIEAFKYLNKIYDTEKLELKLSSNTHTKTNNLLARQTDQRKNFWGVDFSREE